MKTTLVSVSSLESVGLAPLSTRERVDTVRYEESLGDFIKAAWRHANEPQTSSRIGILIASAII